jgi:6-phosphogluconolactonase (cycloisomerase 2 family)
MFAAEILVSKPIRTGGLPHLYVSNRDDSSEDGDTIAIFSLIDEVNGQPKEIPQLVKQVSTGLKHVRGISFGGADDKWLIAGGVNEGGVKVFNRVKGDKGEESLEFVAQNQNIEKPTSFVWL